MSVPYICAFFGLDLTLTDYCSAGAARLLSISAHGHSQTATCERNLTRGSAIEHGNYPYVMRASFFTYVSAHKYSFIQGSSICESIFPGNPIHVTD